MNIYSPFKAISSAWAGFFDKRLWPVSVGGGRETVSLEEVSEDSALNYSAVWCATRLLCGTGAGLPLPLYRGLEGENREKVRNHPVYRVLNRNPNPEMTAFSFRSVMWQWQVNWGNAYAEVEREGNDPDGGLKNLWPIHPSRVRVCRDDNGEMYYHVYGERGAEGVDLDPWKVLHIPSIITYDGLTGHGVIEHARESIGAGIAAEKYGAHWFGGGAVPRAVIMHPGKWQPEARAAFRKEWDELYSSADGHRMALLQGGADIKPITISNEDSQFLGTRQFGVEEIARWYGIPPHMLQHLLRATFNNIEHMGINFVQYSLIEWLNVWEQCIAKKLLNEREQEQMFVEHNVDALMRGDAASRATYYQTLVTSGIMTRNQAMKLENMPEVPGGDTYLVQGAMVPLDEEGKPVSEFASGGTAQEPVANSVQDDDEEDVLSIVAERVQSMLTADMSRILTKESNRIAQLSKKPDVFIDAVDKFYADHSQFITEVVANAIAALEQCGMPVDIDKFVTDWVAQSKEAFMETAGRSTASQLRDNIQTVIKSEAWKSRPERAVHGIQPNLEEAA